LSLIVLSLILLSPNPVDPRAADELLWAYHLGELTRAVTVRDHYSGQVHLAHLKKRDPQRYARSGLDLTRARIAREKGNWATNLEANRAVAADDPALLLEMAESLWQMSRHEETLDTLAQKTAGWRGDLSWRRRELMVRCHLALGNKQQARRQLSLLTRRTVPAPVRMMAYEQLTSLHYQMGDRAEGRALAERVQKNMPASDAALGTMHLQETHEDAAYLSRTATRSRHAMVCYRNRVFDRSDALFRAVIEAQPKSKAADRARYYLARTSLKREDAVAGLAAFQTAMPALQSGGFGGQAAFQLARALLMNGKDLETIAYVDDFRATTRPSRWHEETRRLEILALRRAGLRDRFRALEAEVADGPRWLNRYYHRNGMVWAMQEQRHQDALHHLARYSEGRLGKKERQEARLWEGMILWELGRTADAVYRWLAVLEEDPNHYFGLVARELVRENARFTGLWHLLAPEHPDALADLGAKALRELYYLAPDAAMRARVARHLSGFFEASAPEDRVADLIGASRSAELASAHRYGWAARALRKRRGLERTYHYLASRWYQSDGDLHASLRHAEILTSSYPDWVPYELLPASVQQLNFPKGFAEIVDRQAATFGVDPYLLLAIIREESRFDSGAKSFASARGLMQFIPSTATRIAGEIDEIQSFSLPMLYDPELSITLGAKYVDNLMTTYGGVPLYTVAAYNAGEGAVARWRSFNDIGEDAVAFVWDVTYDETKMYCQKVLRAYHHYTRVYESQERHIIEAPALSQPPSLGDRVMD